MRSSTHRNSRVMLSTYPADIVAGAHDHEPGYECIRQFPLAREAGMDFGGEAYLIKCGTYQDSDYGPCIIHRTKRMASGM